MGLGRKSQTHQRADHRETGGHQQGQPVTAGEPGVVGLSDRIGGDERQHRSDTDGGTDLSGGVEQHAGEALLVVDDAGAAGDRGSEDDVRRSEPDAEQREPRSG